MDLPLTPRVTGSNAFPAQGGGVVQFSGVSAAELERVGRQVLDAYGDPAEVPEANGTPATIIYGMTLSEDRNGLIVCELQIQPDESWIASTDPGTAPFDDRVPVNAIVGGFAGLGYAAIQFIEFSDPSELARLDDWASDFWVENQNRTGVQGTAYLYEVCLAGSDSGPGVAALLWGIQNTSPV